MTANELMDFVESLNEKGLLSKSVEDFDYESLIREFVYKETGGFPSESLCKCKSDTGGYLYAGEYRCDTCGELKLT